MEIKHNAKKATYKLLDELPDGMKFPGIFLQKEIKKRTGELHYPETYLRYMRDYRRKTGRSVVNIDRARSIYLIGGKQ
jgi:hypothetical protein